MTGAFDTAAIAVLSKVIFFHSLPSRVGCSFQGKLFSIFKLLGLVLLHFIFFPALLTLLTQAINLSRLGLCSVWIARENWVSAFASTGLLYPNECQLLDSTVIT